MEYCTPRLQLLTKFHSCPVPASATDAPGGTTTETAQAKQEPQVLVQPMTAALPIAEGSGSPGSHEGGLSPKGPTTPSGAASPEPRSFSEQGSSLDASPTQDNLALEAAAGKPPMAPHHQHEQAQPANVMSAHAPAAGAGAGSVPLPLQREGSEARLGRLGSLHLAAMARDAGAEQCSKPPLHPASSSRMDSLPSSLDSVSFDARSEAAFAAAAAETQACALLSGCLLPMRALAELDW